MTSGSGEITPITPSISIVSDSGSIISAYLNQSAYRVQKSNHILYNALSAAILTLTGAKPSVSFRCAVTLLAATGHIGVSGVVVVGAESLPFSSASRKTTSNTLSALPVVTTSGIDCMVLIEAITTSGAPILDDTLTAIMIRYEAYSSGFWNAQGTWIKTDGQIFCETQMNIGDIIRYNSTDYTVLKREDNPGLDGTNEFYTYLVM